VLNPDIAATTAPAVIETLVKRELKEVERRDRLYRGDRPFPDLHGRTVIVVDDGLATGATMLAAVRAIRTHQPEKVIVAVPVGQADLCRRLATEVDDVHCLSHPDQLLAVGYWYEQFPQVTDADVRAILEQARSAAAAPRA
jgi:putative phosphoribosyl transferase